MTVVGWIIFALISLGVIGISVSVAALDGNVAFGARIGFVISGMILGIMLFYYNGTAAGKRAFKSQKSSLNNGIERTVEVYDATGNLIKTYSGKFDIDYDSNRIIFDDEHDKRHVIYYPTGTVIADEL